MIDKVAEEIKQGQIQDPDKWNRIRSEADRLTNHYRDVIEKKRVSGDRILHFAAYVSNKAMFGMQGVIRLMMDRPDRWDPEFVIVPDISRGDAHALKTYLDARDHFTGIYGAEKVLDGWDINTDTYIDRTGRFDIIYFADPYDSMAPEVHSIKYASSRNVLPVYVNYGYDVGYYTMYARMKNYELNYVWKYFTETVYSLEDCRNMQVIRGQNVVLTGYAKMDAFADCRKPRKKKNRKILLTPHHSVKFDELPLSNFLSYCDLIPTLPKLFPDVDFVFRPHPLLFIRMINDKIWTQKRITNYIDELRQAGIEYSDGGNYLDLFAECDAIINDCGSFTMEWLFTGKPGCFIVGDRLKDEHLTTQMKEAIKRYTIARSADDIIKFISDLADGRYPAKEEMDDWTRENIAVNYPGVSEKILEEMDILKNEYPPA